MKSVSLGSNHLVYIDIVERRRSVLLGRAVARDGGGGGGVDLQQNRMSQRRRVRRLPPGDPRGGSGFCEFELVTGGEQGAFIPDPQTQIHKKT